MNAALMKQMMALYGRRGGLTPETDAVAAYSDQEGPLRPEEQEAMDRYDNPSPDFSRMGGQLADELGAVRQGRGLSDRVFLDQEDNGVGGYVDNADQLFNAPVPRGAREGDYVKDPRRRRR